MYVCMCVYIYKYGRGIAGTPQQLSQPYEPTSATLQKRGLGDVYLTDSPLG